MSWPVHRFKKENDQTWIYPMKYLYLEKFEKMRMIGEFSNIEFKRTLSLKAPKAVSVHIKALFETVQAQTYQETREIIKSCIFIQKRKKSLKDQTNIVKCFGF